VAVGAGLGLTAAVAATVLLLAQRGPDDQEPVYRRYAPTVFLAADETNQPMSAEDFVAASRLRWSHDACPDDLLAAAGAVDPLRLASGGYTHRKKNALCTHSGPTYRSDQRVRPYDLVRDANEGMFLDLDDARRRGGGPDAPVYVDHVPGDHVTYWFFYGFNDAPAALSVVDLFDHEGDWERVSIRLSAAEEPLDVAFFQHNGYCVLPWSQVRRSGTHPLVFSARGTHASYASGGAHPIPVPAYPDPDDVTGQGTRWPTVNRLLMVRDQPWFGFGGGWGQVGTGRHGTGPMGPGAFKDPEPADWTTPVCH
jgi:hypothetical protein